MITPLPLAEHKKVVMFKSRPDSGMEKNREKLMKLKEKTIGELTSELMGYIMMTVHQRGKRLTMEQQKKAGELARELAARSALKPKTKKWCNVQEIYFE